MAVSRIAHTATWGVTCEVIIYWFMKGKCALFRLLRLLAHTGPIFEISELPRDVRPAWCAHISLSPTGDAKLP